MIHKILVVDDDKDLCEVLKKYLEIENYLVEFRHDGVSGLQEVLENSYQLVILDIMLPQKSGFEILTEVRKSSSVPILMLTAKDSEIDKVSGLRLGADDYLTKPFSMNEFIARVQSLIRRSTYFNESISKKELCFDGLVINPDTREVTVDNKKIDLTAKEFDLLYFLAQSRGKVFTKKQIYRNVWEEDYAFDDNNIMVHIRRLRKKIEHKPDAPKFIKTVWGVGYKFGGE
ncbi:DNA-binding response OmpR family regulator [Clostridioides mangenotii]|uniref:Stage 0 sporulation protein A homolog n=1 Tax=Metaclostridioides mangenotii TaxID=1540 RepID=A0ABS4E7U4_9FIRM|nr:DNA-binding response OmpR family regulator [Clostridioides mangenotii]